MLRSEATYSGWPFGIMSVLIGIADGDLTSQIICRHSVGSIDRLVVGMFCKGLFCEGLFCEGLCDDTDEFRAL